MAAILEIFLTRDRVTIALLICHHQAELQQTVPAVAQAALPVVVPEAAAAVAVRRQEDFKLIMKHKSFYGCQLMIIYRAFVQPVLNESKDRHTSTSCSIFNIDL